MVTPFCFLQSRPKSGKISGPSNHSPKNSKPKYLPSPNHTRGWNFPLGWDASLQTLILLEELVLLERTRSEEAPVKNYTALSLKGIKFL
jgi:hypothetical protein